MNGLEQIQCNITSVYVQEASIHDLLPEITAVDGTQIYGPAYVISKLLHLLDCKFAYDTSGFHLRVVLRFGIETSSDTIQNDTIYAYNNANTHVPSGFKSQALHLRKQSKSKSFPKLKQNQVNKIQIVDYQQEIHKVDCMIITADAHLKFSDKIESRLGNTEGYQTFLKAREKYLGEKGTLKPCETIIIGTFNTFKCNFIVHVGCPDSKDDLEKWVTAGLQTGLQKKVKSLSIHLLDYQPQENPITPELEIQVNAVIQQLKESEQKIEKVYLITSMKLNLSQKQQLLQAPSEQHEGQEYPLISRQGSEDLNGADSPTSFPYENYNQLKQQSYINSASKKVSRRGHLPVFDKRSNSSKDVNKNLRSQNQLEEIHQQLYPSSDSCFLNVKSGIESPPTPNLDIGSQYVLNSEVTVLIVDDSFFILKSLKQILQMEMHIQHIHQAENGQKAVETFQSMTDEKTLYHLIIMDVDMPVMTGIRATKRIRSIEQEQSLPQTFICGHTANTDPDVKANAFQAGMNQFIQKPAFKNDFYALFAQVPALKQIQLSCRQNITY